MKNKIKKVRDNLSVGTKICAVVKANAYGCGLEKVAYSLKNVVDYFAVSRVFELVKLREYGIYTKTLLLSPIIDEKQVKMAIKLNGEITIDSLKSLELVNLVAEKLNAIAKVHLKIDTGMNRFGFKDKSEFIDTLNAANKMLNISVVGMYSHLACTEKEYVDEQKRLFDSYILLTHKKGFYPMCHLSSSAMSEQQRFSYDMVRLGINLYLNDESTEFSGQILDIKNVAKGEEIGYSHGYTAKTDMKVAVINIGYGDISIRHLSNIGKVIINGTMCDIVGNVCMDCLFVDVSNVNAKIGDYAILFGKQKESLISICDIAEKCGTISYEIFTSISERVKREYR